MTQRQKLKEITLRSGLPWRLMCDEFPSSCPAVQPHDFELDALRLFRAQQQPIPRNSPERLVQLSSLLTLLRLARRHRNVRPDPEFFAWSVRLVDVHQRAGNVEESLLADVVNELVPLLPEKERAKLTRVIMARSRGTVEAEPSQRLLAPVVQGQLAAPRLLERSQEEGEAGEASETSVRVVLAPATLSLGAEPEPEPLKTYVGATVATGATGLAGARLWALLAKAEKRAELAAEPAASTGMLQSAGSAEEEAPSSLLHVDSDPCLQTAQDFVLFCCGQEAKMRVLCRTC